MNTIKNILASLLIRKIVIAAITGLLFGSSFSLAQDSVSDLREQVVQTERAFARSMKDRDFKVFKSFISPEAVFVSEKRTLRGVEQVADWWKRYFVKPKAPFSWKPQIVEVINSGTLALSTGPVFDPDGKQIATFTSIWRIETGGKWHILFDKGCPMAH